MKKVTVYKLLKEMFLTLGVLIALTGLVLFFITFESKDLASTLSCCLFIIFGGILADMSSRLSAYLVKEELYES